MLRTTFKHPYTEYQAHIPGLLPGQPAPGAVSWHQQNAGTFCHVHELSQPHQLPCTRSHPSKTSVGLLTELVAATGHPWHAGAYAAFIESQDGRGHRRFDPPLTVLQECVRRLTCPSGHVLLLNKSNPICLLPKNMALGHLEQIMLLKH